MKNLFCCVLLLIAPVALAQDGEVSMEMDPLPDWAKNKAVEQNAFLGKGKTVAVEYYSSWDKKLTPVAKFIPVEGTKNRYLRSLENSYGRKPDYYLLSETGLRYDRSMSGRESSKSRIYYDEDIPLDSVQRILDEVASGKLKAPPIEITVYTTDSLNTHSEFRYLFAGSDTIWGKNYVMSDTLEQSTEYFEFKGKRTVYKTVRERERPLIRPLTENVVLHSEDYDGVEYDERSIIRENNTWYAIRKRKGQEISRVRLETDNGRIIAIYDKEGLVYRISYGNQE
jgi:hypothetical protein